VQLEPRVVRRAVAVSALTTMAGVATLASRMGWIGRSHLAATPRAIAQGKVWLLLTSGIVADRPWLASLLGFAIVAFAALSVARVQVVVVAAFAGQVLATLAVYGFIGLARALHAGVFHAVMNTPDIGLSAIIAGWIGVIAQDLWRRYRSRRAHVLNALGCVGCALIGLAFRPNVTVLDTEHIVAFALGVAIAAWWPHRISVTTAPFGNRRFQREMGGVT
jgi:lambda repressor-like predicted transcriptional regulator